VFYLAAVLAALPGMSVTPEVKAIHRTVVQPDTDLVNMIIPFAFPGFQGKTPCYFRT
jgi:hypothetical protein